MPRGSKEKYTDKQKRRAHHIEESAQEQGKPKKTAQRIAYATINKEEGGGKKSGSGRGKEVNRSASSKGGKIGGKKSHGKKKTSSTKTSGKKAA